MDLGLPTNLGFQEPGTDLFAQAVFGNQQNDIELPTDLDEPILDLDEAVTHLNSGESANEIALKRVLYTLNKLSKEKAICRAFASESVDLIPEAFQLRGINTYSITPTKVNYQFAAEALGLKGWLLVGAGISALLAIVLGILNYFGVINLSSGGGGGGGGGGGNNSGKSAEKAADRLEKNVFYISKLHEVFTNSRVLDHFKANDTKFVFNETNLTEILRDNDERTKFKDGLKEGGFNLSDSTIPVDFDLLCAVFIGVAKYKYNDSLYSGITEESADKKKFNIDTGYVITKGMRFFEKHFLELMEHYVIPVSDILKNDKSDSLAEITKKIGEDFLIINNEEKRKNTVDYAENLIKALNKEKEEMDKKNQTVSVSGNFDAFNSAFISDKKFVLNKQHLLTIFDVLSDYTKNSFVSTFNNLFLPKNNRHNEIKSCWENLNALASAIDSLNKTVEELGKKGDANSNEIKTINDLKKVLFSLTKEGMEPVKIMLKIMDNFNKYVLDFKKCFIESVTIINGIYEKSNNTSVTGINIKVINEAVKNKTVDNPADLIFGEKGNELN